MGFRPELIDGVMDLLASAKERAKALKAEADAAARIEKVWEELHSFMAKDWPLHILELLDRELTLLKALRAEGHPAVQAIEGVYRDAKEQADSVKRRYPSYLEEACRSAGLTLDPESRHPTYSLEQRFFQLKVDEQKWVARLSDHEGRLADLPADVGAVVEVLLRERKRIFGRPFNGPKFLKLLRSQYLAVVKKHKEVDGASIPIRHITRRLGKNAKGFRSDEFLIDLSRLVEQGPMEIDGYRLDLQQTKDTKQGMLLHGVAGRGYIGFVVFRKV
jgi:flagellar biosynthesis regulator FlaF